VNARCAADRTTQGEVLRLVMDGMAEAGFDVSPPESGESRMTIACAGAQCTLMVTDEGHATWDYCPWPADNADPDLAADLVVTLLTGRPGPHSWLTRKRGGISFKGLVGRELKARGLAVDLAVYTDEAYFDAFAEIVATAPGTDGEAEVCVADDGCLTWTRSYRAGAETVVAGPEDCGRLADPDGVAAAVVATVTRAMSCLVPGGQGRAA
jgi:hypothetical protein